MLRVAIVGRPNVGKSTLFNRLCGHRRAIVGDEPGITRDRIYGSVQWQGRSMEFIDTGGMIPEASETIPSKILEQVRAAIGESDVLLLVVDGRAGITPLDEQLAPLLRKASLPVFVAVNKMDTAAHEPEAAVFYSFGFTEVFPISAEHNRGVADLLDALASQATAEAEAVGAEQSGEIAVAVVGRPNVGKSSLVNRLLGSDRTIVSEAPGTTRDAVDTALLREGVRYRVIDTAGIRRKGKTEGRTEKVSVVVARKNLERADVALLLLDAAEGVTKLDAAIGGYCYSSGCSVIIVLNKWDLVEKDLSTVNQYTAAIRRRMKYLSFAPVLTVSALTGQRVSKLFEMLRLAQEGRQQRIATGLLNNLFVPDLSRMVEASGRTGRLEIRYITQARTAPPTFVVFTTGKDRMHFSTERFLVNQLREKFGFFAAPIRIQQRTRKSGARSRRRQS